ncbi:hypothetical protein CKM354_001047900 [Cercospora kikuchii]|uniref:Uncharacterized protein n=1 Tax=Cercospora kikuchii TaxID=84275 RepID=A0A9P3FHB9_9PEZI|nr:uncharacterized protein CKM354_001047900 [Cercospora kikuchii]GIZ47386.1 hypothetical protein CKM354_001047900 [Cercospora kikuchii]
MPYPMRYLRRAKNHIEMDKDYKIGSKAPSNSQASLSKSNSSNLSRDLAPRKKLQKKAKIPKYLNESYKEGEDKQTSCLSFAKRTEIRSLLGCSKRDYEKPSEDYYAWVPRVRTVPTKTEDQHEGEHGLRRATDSGFLRTGELFEAASPRRWTIRRVYDTEEDDEDEKKFENDQEEYDDEVKEDDEQERGDSDDHGKDETDANDNDSQQQPFWNVNESLSARETESGGDVQDLDTIEDKQEDKNPSSSQADLLPKLDSKNESQSKKKFPRLATNIGCRIRSSHPRPLTPVQEVEEPESEEDEVSDYATADDGESAEICTAERLEVRVVRMSMEAKDEMRKMREQSGGVSSAQEEKVTGVVEEGEEEWRSESIWERIGRRRAMEGRS